MTAFVNITTSIECSYRTLPPLQLETHFQYKRISLMYVLLCLRLHIVLVLGHA